MVKNGSPEPCFETDDNYSYFITTLPIHPAFLAGEGVNEGVNEGDGGIQQIKYQEDKINELINGGISEGVSEGVNGNCHADHRPRRRLRAVSLHVYPTSSPAKKRHKKSVYKIVNA